MRQIPQRLKKDMLIALGVCFLVIGYWQLFSPPPEPAYLDQEVAIIGPDKLALRGKVIRVHSETLEVAVEEKILTVKKNQVLTVNGSSVHDDETWRAIRAVAATIIGGLMIWIAVFVL